jgi:hypothetical protein
MNSRGIKVFLIEDNPGDTQQLTWAHSEPGLRVAFYFTAEPGGKKKPDKFTTRAPWPEFELRPVLTGKASDIDPPFWLENFC